MKQKHGSNYKEYIHVTLYNESKAFTIRNTLRILLIKTESNEAR